MKNVTISSSPSLFQGELSFPGDKSLSHRAIIFGSLARGVSEFTNVLEGEDCVCTRKAFESMGVEIRSSGSGELTIVGKGLHALRPPASELYLGNSGTSMRLLLGLLAGQSFPATLTGDPSLSSRPMKRVTDPLRAMGAHIEGASDANFAPLKISGASLRGGSFSLSVASAQVKSALLLAGLYAKGQTRVTEPELSRDHTERFLSYFGVGLKREGLTVSIEPEPVLEARSFRIAGDISSAAFFMAIAALFPSSKLSFKSVLWNPTRIGFVKVLERMGVEVQINRHYDEGPEPVVDFTLKRSARLKAFVIEKKELPSLIDEIPILTVLATQAEGTSVIREASELRVKETDRIESMSTGLSRMGARIASQGDTVTIQGETALTGATISSYKDHRTAMSHIVAGLIAVGPTRVEDVECIATSFPNFFDLLTRIGGRYQLTP